MRFLICSVVLFSIVSTLQAASLFNCRNTGNVCGVNGQCNRRTGQCDCSSGYTGERCLVFEANLCTTLNCNGNGLCEVRSGVAQCICNAGFTGDRCQNEPMSCACTATDMTVRMNPPGTFTEGIGYVVGKRDEAGCQAERLSGTDELTISTPFDSSVCGALTQVGGANGEYSYSRTYRYYYDDLLITNFGIDFTCHCIFGPTEGVFYARFDVNQDDFSNLIQEEGINYITPVSYVLRTAGGTLVTRTSLLVVGDLLTLTVTADTDYCVLVERIVVNNSLTGADYREAVLMDNRCLTTTGKQIFEAETVYTGDLTQGVLNMEAFLFPNSFAINIAVYFTALPTGQCILPTCTASGRKKRQAEGEEADGSSGTFQQIIYINNPESTVEQEDQTSQKECNMTTHVMIGLIAMAGVICILLVICFVVGLRMIMAKRRSTVEPPAYK